jgi:hypothetical protein
MRTMTHYTLGTAANACGLNKSTVLRAIKAGKISATRDEHSQWQIDPAEMHRVYPPVASNPEEQRSEQRYAPAQQRDRTDELVAELRARLEDMRNERDRARTDADAWRAAFERELAQRALPAPGNVAQSPETTPATPNEPRKRSVHRRSAVTIAPRVALDARDGLKSWCNSTEGRDPHHETDRHRPSLDAVRCSRWRHLSSAHASAAELCCRDLPHPGRLHRAQQPFSLLPLTSLRRAWRWMRATGCLAGAGLLLVLATGAAGAQQQQQHPQQQQPQEECFTVLMNHNTGGGSLGRCTGKTWVLARANARPGYTAVRWFPITMETTEALAGSGP